ncbi:MAG: hypothetical protein AB8G15_11185 [Saprospiraceae bacterium]
MDLRTEILKEHSKKQAVRLADFVGKNTTRFAALMELFLRDNLVVCQRSSWVVIHAVQQYPSLISPYLEEMIDNLDKEVHSAVKRNTVRIFQDIAIPEELLGKAVDVCFRLLDDPQEAIAVRVFSMQVLYNACLREPDLKDELRITIESHLEFGSSGFISRGKKILKALQKG